MPAPVVPSAVVPAEVGGGPVVPVAVVGASVVCGFPENRLWKM